MPRRDLRARGQAILARMELAHAADAMVTDLPFGHQKLVGLARTLMNDGALLLLDEPMAGVEGACLRNHAACRARGGRRRSRGLRGGAQCLLHQGPLHARRVHGQRHASCRPARLTSCSPAAC